MLILDFSKASYKVPHERLMVRLKYHGVKDKTLEWITSWLTNRAQSTVVDGSISRIYKPVAVTSGVPQITVLGPLMFLPYVNDIQEDLECTLRLFAGDTLLYHRITCETDTITLQCHLDKLGSWAESWQMVFNPVI